MFIFFKCPCPTISDKRNSTYTNPNILIDIFLSIKIACQYK
ncbi:hypothetical protein BVAVS116_E0061 (plasmid) [Borreliella valaisiana VS116]|uniref:Uncharacterized protein n=1 Tax=Borreliella valaisiana VS116 TaxID=445987 RepID=C0R8U2_BORVA|nr:hypothetical protein BVAVS116_E0061 [Borreliella valaisiana VS116]